MEKISYPHFNHSTKLINVNQSTLKKTYRVRLESVGIFNFGEDPSQKLWAYHLSVNDVFKDYILLFKGVVDDKDMPILNIGNSPLFARIDSGCTPGQLYRVSTCDCGEQLSGEIKELTEIKNGFILHIPSQDGRGYGIDHNLASSYVKEKYGMYMNDFDDLMGVISDNHDMRDLSGAVACLKYLGLSTNQSINLATNNPIKIAALQDNGYTVIRKKSNHAKTEKQKMHLQNKMKNLGHLK